MVGHSGAWSPVVSGNVELKLRKEVKAGGDISWISHEEMQV